MLRSASTTETEEQMRAGIEMIGLEAEPDVTEETPPPAAVADVEVVPPAESTTAAEPGTAEPSTQETRDEPEPEDHVKFSRGVQKKIDRLTRERFEEKGAREAAEARNAALEAKLAEATAAKPADAKVEPKPVEAAPRPKLDDFEGDFEKYTEALTDWKLAEQDRKHEAKLQAEIARLKTETSQSTTEQLDLAERSAAFEERKAATREAHANYDEVFARSGDVNLSPAMQDAIADYGEESLDSEILFYLMEHPDECKTLCDRTLYDPQKTSGNRVLAINREVAKAIDRIAAKVKAGEKKEPEPAPKSEPTPAPPKPKASNAPEPITPVRGGSVVNTKDPSTMSVAEMRAFYQSPEGAAWYLRQGGTKQALTELTRIN